MRDRDDFVGRLRGVVVSLWGTLSSEECAEVEHLIEHDELGEALRTLAWIIVEEDKRVPAEVVTRIEELAFGLVEPRHMPTALQDHMLNE
jgi:hypothetical protein